MEIYNWPSDKNFMKENDRKNADAMHQTAKRFVLHLEQLIANSSHPDSSSIQLSKKVLYQDFTYPKIAKDTWLNYDKKNYGEYEQAHYCARREGLIAIDEEVRPYKYTILQPDEKTFQLRPYQKNIIEDATDADSSVLIEAPTGAGKSVMANEIAKNEIEKGGRVLIVAPKIILLEQLEETFSELEPQIIHGAKDYDKGHSVFISTIQTAHKRDLGFEPTMILIDEVHFGFSGKMIKALLSDFKGRLIGLSATPYDERGEALKGFELHINKYNLRYMLENQYLLHPKCYAPLKVNLSNVGMVGADYNQADLDSEFNNLESISQIVASTKDTILKRKASLIFCINISHSEALAKAYTDAGIPTKAIHSKLTTAEKKSILEDFKSAKLRMLANPMMLTTGFDHPMTDTIILARATKSQNLYRQMVGRALRLSEGKKDAVILDCSNVIGNLGLPTDDIKKRDNGNIHSIRICGQCKSEKLYKKITNNQAYMCCADCGHSELTMENGYECEACGLVHTNNAQFKSIDGDLYLLCDECEAQTLVSVSSSKEEMSLIFDSSYIDEIKKKITLAYFKYLIEKTTPAFILEPEVSKHIKALQALIFKDPSIFVALDADHFYSHCLEAETRGSSTKYIWKRNFEKDWRLFHESKEDEILNEGLNDLNQKLKGSHTLKNSLDLIQAILKLTKEPLLEDQYVENLLQDVKKSKVKDIDIICNKRLKDLHFSHADLSQMRGFVQLMESVL